MMSPSNMVAVGLLVVGVVAGVWDISATQERTIVVYTTPALRDVLEKDILPEFQRVSGARVAPVYVAAGQQFNRLRMSGDHPEADLFLHASPLYLEKGYAEGRVTPVAPPIALDPHSQSRDVDGRRIWVAFAWSPLVEVYPESARAVDLAQSNGTFGLPHPLLSNNGVYVVQLLEATDPAVGANLLATTRVQPTNARATIGGVADGSFSLTLGYEAVARFYQRQGAPIAYALPIIEGETVTARVVFSAGLIEGTRHPSAEALVRFLFTDPAQQLLAKHDFRPVVAHVPPGAAALPLGDARVIEGDWEQWEALEAILPRYEVKP